MYRYLYMCMNYLDVGLNLKKVQHILIFKHVHKHTKNNNNLQITYKPQRPREIDLNCHLYDLIDTKFPPGFFLLSGVFLLLFMTCL